MKRLLLLTVLLSITLISTSASSADRKPTKSTTPLSEDEIAIYKSVLQQYASKESESLNVSMATSPLDLSSHQSQPNGCLKGIELSNLTSAGEYFHLLTAEVLPGTSFRLVDHERQAKIVNKNDPSKTIRGGKSVDAAVSDAFSTGIFSMSEIAFDKEHRHAVMSYGFWCGSLCGNGSTPVFEKIGGEWKKTNRNCGGWIS